MTTARLIDSTLSNSAADLAARCRAPAAPIQPDACLAVALAHDEGLTVQFGDLDLRLSPPAVFWPHDHELLHRPARADAQHHHRHFIDFAFDQPQVPAGPRRKSRTISGRDARLRP